MHKRNLQLLLHPLFITSIILLFLNDVYLKYAFPNPFTGKLSDFTGLFAFIVFLLAFLPGKKIPVFIFSGLFFAWWKSSLSQPFIESFNSFSPVEINRVVDYSDLLALISLPAAYIFSFGNYSISIPYRRVCLNIVCLISLFAFCYTTGPRRIMYDYPQNFVSFYERFTTTKTEEEILQKLSSQQLKYSFDSVHFYQLSHADLYLLENNVDSAQWKKYQNTGDSILYVREPDSPFYRIAAYQLDDDRMINIEFRFEKGKRKNVIYMLSFQSSQQDLSAFYSGKLKRKYKRHFKEFFK